MPLTNAGAGLCLSGPGLVAATRYFSLYVGDPSGAGTEVSATGYARLSRTAANMTVTDNAVSVAAGEWEDSAQATWGNADLRRDALRRLWRDAVRLPAHQPGAVGDHHRYAGLRRGRRHHHHDPRCPSLKEAVHASRGLGRPYAITFFSDMED